MKKNTVTHKKFRQINSLVTSLVTTLFSRNFCQRWVTVNFHNFHTEQKMGHSSKLNQFDDFFVKTHCIYFLMHHFDEFLEIGCERQKGTKIPAIFFREKTTKYFVIQ